MARLLAPALGVAVLATAGVAFGSQDGERAARGAQQGGTLVTPPGYPFAPRPCDRPMRFRRSRALGRPFRGRLVRGVRLPLEGCDFFTWDFPLQRVPNRHWRRWGTDYLLRKLLRVIRAHREANPDAPRVAIGDLSRRHGGIFDERFGGVGHVSHQNGLDVDIYYPRKDRRERAPSRVRQVDRRLSQDLVRRFVRAHVKFIFVGPRLRLRGPRRIVQRLAHHDDHMHVRIYPRKRRRR